MSQPIRLGTLSRDEIHVDKRRVGISYSGGGPLVLVELGCAKAFIECGIRPVAIAGVSAGALAGAAHALDPVDGAGIDLACELLADIHRDTLALGWRTIAWRLLRKRTKFTSLGDNAPIGPRVVQGIHRRFEMQDVTLGSFPASGRPRLMIAATDRLSGESYWFPPETPLPEALIASSAIPAVFPWVHVERDGQSRVLVDGGVVNNQPISELAIEEHCGTLFVCAVGSSMPALMPTNALNNALVCVDLMMHQAMKLEEELVRTKLGDRATIHHIHPPVAVEVQNYQFTRPIIRAVVEESRRLTVEWLEGLGFMQPTPAA